MLSGLTVLWPMDWGLPNASVHGIFQARIPEWIVISSSRGSFQARDLTQISCTVGRFFTAEPLVLICGKKNNNYLLGHKLGFPGGSMVKNMLANAGDVSLISRSGRSPGEGNDNLFQHSCLENPMDRRAWRATYSPCCKELNMTEQLCSNNRT